MTQPKTPNPNVAASCPECEKYQSPNKKCTASQQRFFNWLNNSTIRGMAKDLGTTPTMIFTLAAKEGGWTKEDLDHNEPLNNPFGLNHTKKGEAVGNKGYVNLEDAVSDWKKSIHAAPYVQGITDPGKFADALLAHGYNSKDPDYKKKFVGIAKHMSHHMADCGVKE